MGEFSFIRKSVMDHFVESTTQIFDIAEKISDLVKENGGEDPKACLEIAEKLRNEPFRVLVLGEFSRGKSTFVNAIIGDKVLPVSVRPTTAVLCTIINSPKKEAKIKYRDEKTPSTIVPLNTKDEIKTLDKIVTAKNKDANTIAMVEIYYPLPGIKLPFELVDTPGVNDIDTLREEITYGYLGKADAAIFLLDLQQPLSASEKRFLEEKVLGNDLKKLLFVVNKVDQIRNSEDENKAINHIRKNLEKLEADLSNKIVPISSKKALNGRKNEDSDEIVSSRFPTFESELLKFLESSSGAGRINVAASRIFRHGSLFLEHLNTLKGALRGEKAELEGKINDFQKKIQDLNQDKNLMVADIQLSTKNYGTNARAKAKNEIGLLRNDVSRILSSPDFPSDDLVLSLRTKINLGLRNALSSIDSVTNDELQRIEKIYGFKDSMINASGNKELTPVNFQLSSENRTIQQNASNIRFFTAFIGTSLLGLSFVAAVPLGLFGGWLATVFANQKEVERIRSQIQPALAEIEVKVDTGISQSIDHFKNLLEERFLKPKVEEINQIIKTQEEMKKGIGLEVNEREKRYKHLEIQSNTLKELLNRISKLSN
jgi:small GTP-binding protein